MVSTSCCIGTPDQVDFPTFVLECLTMRETLTVSLPICWRSSDSVVPEFFHRGSFLNFSTGGNKNFHSIFCSGRQACPACRAEVARRQKRSRSRCRLRLPVSVRASGQCQSSSDL